MQIRIGTTEDTSSIQALETAARTRYFAISELAFVAAAPPLSAERIEAGDLTIAEIEARLVGFVLTTMVDERLYIANISVAPDASGRGIGNALIKSTIDRAVALGLSAAILTTFLAPAWNAPWFTRLGFTPIPDSEIGPGLRQIIQRQAQSVDPKTRATLWFQIQAA